MAEVRRAVLAGHRLRIRYAAAGQTPKWRTVDPIGLVTVRDQGYLLATRSGADRTYRLSRVSAAEELAEPAQRADRVDLDRAWQERSAQFRTGGDQVTVVVRVDPARREDLVGTALAVRAEEVDADGRLRLEVTFQDERHAEWALWQLATNAEALAPQWLRTSCATVPPRSPPATKRLPERGLLDREGRRGTCGGAIEVPDVQHEPGPGRQPGGIPLRRGSQVINTLAAVPERAPGQNRCPAGAVHP